MKNLISVICAAALGSLMICANAAEPFQPLTKLRPSMTLKLYPEGQNVDNCGMSRRRLCHCFLFQ